MWRAVIESVIFLIVAVVIYFAADGILNRIEYRLGRRLESRTLIFFALLLSLALISFALIRWLSGA